MDIGWLYLTPRNSHDQDYYIVNWGIPINLHLPLLLGFVVCVGFLPDACHSLRYC